MTVNKDLKRLVRARMRKTGESYTAARAQILRKSAESTRARVAPRAASPALAAIVAPKPADYARLAGLSDASVKAKTGCGWENWVKALDHHGAENMSHAEIAAMVAKKYKTSGWWSQMVTVGYERIKGLRARRQQRDGSFQASKSRTFPVPVETLFNAWSDGATRRRWLDGAAVRVRTATKPKSMRVDWPDGTILAVGFTAKGRGKSAVAVQQMKLPSRDAVDAARAAWAGRFDALGAVLASP